MTHLLPEHSVTALDVVHHSDALAWLRGAPSDWIHCAISSPPYYGLRRYTDGDGREIGLEDTPAAYVARLVAVFREIRRVLRPDGVAWLNLGDSYAGNATGSDTTKSGLGGGKMTQTVAGKRIDKLAPGLKPKDLIGIPWRVAFALQADGWYLRSDIIWNRPNPMPESVRDRPTKSHEYIFLLTKNARYWYDADAIAEPSGNTSGWARQRQQGTNTWKYNDRDDRIAVTGQRIESSTFGDMTTRNKRTVWTVPTSPSALPHFAMFPQALIEPMVLAGCPAQVCAVCGAPYARVVERVAADSPASYNGSSFTRGKTFAAADAQHAVGQGPRYENRATDEHRPTCSCHAAGTRPGIVFDPFMGSGTTALVAQRLGRHFVGTDINREYVELARTRLRYRGDDRRMVREQEAGVEQIALFG